MRKNRKVVSITIEIPAKIGKNKHIKQMAYQDNGFQGERKELIDVSSLGIVCGECGVKIEKLPFQPTEKQDGTYGRILCYTCIKKRPRKDFQPRANFGGGGFNRQHRED